ncbi:hypothetical protein AVEN_219770-1, partial [Araneus ventricosus]
VISLCMGLRLWVPGILSDLPGLRKADPGPGQSTGIWIPYTGMRAPFRILTVVTNQRMELFLPVALSLQVLLRKSDF